MKYTFVDLFAEFIDAEGQMDAKYAVDGLHLNPAGYAHWVELLKKGKYL
jgi:lysophospholipase L1-like esterase